MEMPEKLVIIDEGNIFRSVFAEILYFREMLRVSRTQSERGEGALSPDSFPIVMSAGLWAKKKPLHDNITQYDFWLQNQEEFEKLCDEFSVDLKELESRTARQVDGRLLEGVSLIYAFTDEEVAELKKRFPEKENYIKRFDQAADIPGLEFEDVSQALTVETARRMLTDIQRICRERVEGSLREREIERKNETLPLKVKR